MSDFGRLRNICKKTTFCAAAIIALTLFFIQAPGAGDASENKGYMPTFGKGPIDVRVYANYFCGPCREMEPVVKPILHELIENGKIRLTFIDVPMHQAMPYIRHYLYAMNANGSIANAFTVRGLLFDIALQQGDEENIRKTFEAENIAYEPYDLTETFAQFNEWLRSDRIRSTPSMVISADDTTEMYRGMGNILEALEKIKGGEK